MKKGAHLGVQLQPRDFELLRGLFESRVMTLAHVSALYFDGKREMAKKRVQKLKAAGLGTLPGTAARPGRTPASDIAWISCLSSS